MGSAASLNIVSAGMATSPWSSQTSPFHHVPAELLLKIFAKIPGREL